MDFTLGSHESAKRGEKSRYYRFALPSIRAPAPSSYFPNSFTEIVWKVLGGRDGGLRSALWRAGDTPPICPTTNGVASVRIFPSPQGGDVLGYTAYGRSSTPSSTF